MRQDKGGAPDLVLDRLLEPVNEIRKNRRNLPEKKILVTLFLRALTENISDTANKNNDVSKAVDIWYQRLILDNSLSKKQKETLANCIILAVRLFLKKDRLPKSMHLLDTFKYFSEYSLYKAAYQLRESFQADYSPSPQWEL